MTTSGIPALHPAPAPGLQAAQFIITSSWTYSKRDQSSRQLIRRGDYKTAIQEPKLKLNKIEKTVNLNVKFSYSQYIGATEKKWRQHKLKNQNKTDF